MLNLLTCTGMRPDAWELCQLWMSRQTYKKPVRWVIVDDGPVPQKITFQRNGWELVIVRPEPFWSGNNTQHRNLLAGLENITKGARLAFIEDDDYYPADWLETIDRELDRGDLVGMIPNRYYNVKTGQTHECSNSRHSSLCSTAIKGEINYHVLKTQTERCKKLIDIQIWKHCQNRHTFNSIQVIGMKAMPGRGGIAGGHTMSEKNPCVDLQKWIGDDAKYYERFREV